MRLSGYQKPKFRKEVDKSKNESCFRCGKTPLVKGHQLKCPARDQECRACEKLGHFEKVCGANAKNPRARSGKVRLIRDGSDHDIEMEDASLDENVKELYPTSSIFKIESS